MPREICKRSKEVSDYTAVDWYHYSASNLDNFEPIPIQSAIEQHVWQ